VPLREWNPETLEHFRRFFLDRIAFNQFLGMELVKLDQGFVRLEIPFRPELVGDPMRPALHGGVISALVDTCGGAAVFTETDPPHDRVSTIDLRVDYLRPGDLKRLCCEATVMRMGNRVASTDMRVFHPETPDVLVATGKGVYNVKRVTSKASGAPDAPGS
jgi:uncharacterized protein (TIGR00369 family)